MFETTIDRVERHARSRAGERRREIAERLEAGLPDGIRVEETERGVRLSGRGLNRRAALDPGLGWLIAEVTK